MSLTMFSDAVLDTRWEGQHGIGRYAAEVRRRLPTLPVLTGRHPVSVTGLLELEGAAWQERRRPHPRPFLTPGYAVPVSWPGPVIPTIHDLIHLQLPAESSPVHRIYYERVVRPAVRAAPLVFTVSEYSRADLAAWAGLDPSRIVVSGNGVSSAFTATGPTHTALDADGGPTAYVLYVGNRKPHKNLDRTVEAVAQVPDPRLRLLVSGAPDARFTDLLRRHGLAERTDYLGEQLTDEDLAAAYRGASAVLICSLFEGFGIPAVEGMACGAPVVAANRTSLPEIVGDAALTVDPEDVDAIAGAITSVLTDEGLASRLRRAGVGQARRYTWDAVAERVRAALGLPV